MAFTFDSTVGGADSNSYVSVSEADDYFGGRYPNTYWVSKTNTEKEQLLASSTRRLDAELYNGNVTNEAVQRLQWPRDPVFDRNSYPYASDEIPENLKIATYELAYFFLEADDRIMTEAELHDAAMMDGFGIGPLDYKWNSKTKMDMLPARVTNELLAIGYGVWLPGLKVTQAYR